MVGQLASFGLNGLIIPSNIIAFVVGVTSEYTHFIVFSILTYFFHWRKSHKILKFTLFLIWRPDGS